MSEEIYINSGSTFQQPYIGRASVNAQQPTVGRTPFIYTAQGRSPFTYQAQNPATYQAQGQGQTPYIANAQQPYPYIANAQTPYIANATQPYPFIANAQQPYIANAQQPYPYIANAQTPYIANAQQPYPYIANAQQPYIANARNPFTYQAQGNTQQPYPFSFQNPFTFQAQGQTPYPYIASGRRPVSVQSPYTFSTQQPVIGRTPYIYAGDVSYIGSYGVSYGEYTSRSSGSATATCSWIFYAYYTDLTIIELRILRQQSDSGGYYNTSNVFQSPNTYADLPQPVTSAIGLCYYIDDVPSGYSVRYNINSTNDDGIGSSIIDGYSSSPCNATMTTSAQSISMSTIRGVRFRKSVTVTDGEFEAGFTVWNVSFIFEKSGSTTFTKTFDIELLAEAESFGGQ